MGVAACLDLGNSSSSITMGDASCVARNACSGLGSSSGRIIVGDHSCSGDSSCSHLGEVAASIQVGDEACKTPESCNLCVSTESGAVSIPDNTTSCSNECEAGTDNCDPNASCTDTSAGFICTCNIGFEDNGQSCVSFGTSCEAGTDNCDPNTICSSTMTGFTCNCPIGFEEGDGQSCTPMDCL